MARTLSQIIRSLNSVYNPQVKSIRQQQSLIPEQIASEEKGLEARQEQAFGQILGGARQRGLGFSGIPLAEQATYTSTEFLPALARLRQTGREQAMSLEDAILGIRERQRTLGQQIYDSAQARALEKARLREERRQFNEQLKLRREEMAEARRAAASGGGGGGGFALGGGSVAAGSSSRKKGGAKVPAGLQQLYNQVFVKSDGSLWGDRELVSDYNRTKISAGYGNRRDKQKLQLYHSVRPDLFGRNVPAAAFANSNNLRF